MPDIPDQVIVKAFWNSVQLIQGVIEKFQVEMSVGDPSFEGCFDGFGFRGYSLEITLSVSHEARTGLISVLLKEW